MFTCSTLNLHRLEINNNIARLGIMGYGTDRLSFNIFLVCIVCLHVVVKNNQDSDTNIVKNKNNRHSDENEGHPIINVRKKLSKTEKQAEHTLMRLNRILKTFQLTILCKCLCLTIRLWTWWPSQYYREKTHLI